MTGPQRSHILQSHPKLFLLLLLYFHSLKKTDAKLDTFMESCKTLYFHSSFSYLPYLIPPAVRQIGQGLLSLSFQKGGTWDPMSPSVTGWISGDISSVYETGAAQYAKRAASSHIYTCSSLSHHSSPAVPFTLELLYFLLFLTLKS